MDGVMATIIMFAGNFAPRNWAFCSGQILSISSNTALFSLLGTTYGGNGQTTFALPDLRGRVPVGTGQGLGLANVTLGEVAGATSVTLIQSNLPAHIHTVNVPTSDGNGTSDEPNGNILAVGNESIFAATSSASGSYGGVTSGITGGNQPFGIRTPYLGMNYVICIAGIFPSRN